MINIILDVICSIIIALGCLGVTFLFVVYIIGVALMIIWIIKE